MDEKGRNWRVFGVVWFVAIFIFAMLNQSAMWEKSRGIGFPELSMRVYWMMFAASWVMLSTFLWILSRQAEKVSGKGVTWCVILVALVARVVVVCGTNPVLSDDVWRYIHDGATFARGVNPYLHAPADLPGAGAGVQHPVPRIVDRINNVELITIYQPASQFVFAALDRVWTFSPDFVKRWDPDHDKTFRLGFVLFDMVLIAVILAWLRDMGKSAWWAVAYAWHPLAISEVAGSGHQDPVGIAMLVTALWLASRLVKMDRDRSLSRKRLAIAAGIAFGLAIAVKPIILPIAFVLAWMLRRRPGLIAWSAGTTVLTGVALYLPFILMDGGLTGMFDTGRTFIDKWAFNSLAYDLFVRYVAEKPMADYAALAVLLLVLIVTSIRERTNPARPAAAFLFASLLVSSTVHPWYLLWALALMPICFSPAFWVFSLTVTASYAAHLHEGYRVPTWVVIGEYLPVYAVLIWELLKGFRDDQPFSGRACPPDVEQAPRLNV